MKPKKIALSASSGHVGRVYRVGTLNRSLGLLTASMRPALKALVISVAQ